MENPYKKIFWSWVIEWQGSHAAFQFRHHAMKFANERLTFSTDVKVWDNANLTYVEIEYV